MKYRIRDIERPKNNNEYLLTIDVVNPWYIRWFTGEKEHTRFYMGSPTVFRKWKNGWVRCSVSEEVWLCDVIYNHENKL